MRLPNIVLSVTLAAAVAAPASAQAEPQRRGPVLPVIREQLSRYPQHPRFEARGPVTISSIASSVWSGPVTTTHELTTRNRSRWSDPVFSDTWNRLRAEQDEVWVDRDPGPADTRR
ncbi:hypothetical protein [Phenylobacterium sp.]|uniref:hypothetical protein n=1 Tax=Phenylobacterium sp. TaxID=1871053 RepID=UPI00122A8264|nr:hypothetical protein [Phenylobacterium sp.]TAL32620.1 MAG: hypothetical protein EPN98_13760 [Phenylobacterium sp.]